MTHSLVASPNREVLIGAGLPFCVIGECINPSGKPQLAAAMASGDLAPIQALALDQVEAGAAILDVNAGLSRAGAQGSEAALLARIIKAVEDITDAPIAIDSADPAALAAGLEACRGRPLLNSVSGQEDRLELLLPLARKHDVAVVALCHDGTGISENPDTRFAIARMIVERAQDHGISTRDVIVDPLVLPQGAPGSAAAQLFPLVRRLAEELKVNTICGASNISFGHPDRAQRNAAFLRSAIENGLTSAIMNPLSGAEMDVVRSTPKAGSARFPLDAKNS